MLLTFFFAGLILIAALDQFTKLVAVEELMQVGTIPVVPDVFCLQYIENTGAGFGVFASYTTALSVLTLLIVIAVIAYVVMKRPKHRLFITALTFMMGGAIGNLVDRIRLGYVVDFLKFQFIDFPIFNIADCFITVGAVMFAIYVIFLNEKKEQTDGNDEGRADG